MSRMDNEYGSKLVLFLVSFQLFLLTCRVFDFRMKAGRVVILLAGRRAGKKAVIVKQFDEGKKGKAFPHALVAGIERAPMKVAKKMSKKKIARRSTLKPFVKIVNYNHILPTRFLVTGEFAAKEGSELKTVVTEDKYSNKESRKNLKKEVKAIFTER
jgi:large subunit ribosomal protein L27e